MKINFLRQFHAHLATLTAYAVWGFALPVGKAVMHNPQMTPGVVTFFRLSGTAALFWLLSLFLHRERVSGRDKVRLLLASLFGIVFCQGLTFYGLALTSPLHAAVICSSTPMIALALSALFCREPVSGGRIAGILTGAAGALLLVFGTLGASAGRSGSLRGDLICLATQLSFAVYLVGFRPLIARYSAVTVMKYLFLFATVCCLQPTAAALLAFLWGMEVFRWRDVAAALLVFAGLYIVTRSGAVRRKLKRKNHFSTGVNINENQSV